MCCKVILAIFILLNFWGVVQAIDVSGVVNGTWSNTQEPYNVVGNITVQSGEYLIINPGVTVNVTGNYQLTVQGQLQVAGSVADSVRFILALGNDLWQGIRLENPSVMSSLSFAYLEKAEYGINSVLGLVQINHCRFNNNKKGLQSYGIGSANPPVVLVQNSIFENSRENGILIVQNSNTDINHCEIRYNGNASQYRGAIQLSNQSTGGSCSPSISFNHIHHNCWQGITAWDMVGTNAINPMIFNNLIENNYTGVYLLNSSGYLHDNQIINNFIPGNMNSGAGVMISGATSQPYFELNIVTGNYTGFYITNNALPCLGNLAINHIWAQGENTIQNNIDANGILHSVYCDAYPQSGNTIYAENNYWDANDAAGIAVGINDHIDNPALPTVDFEPFLQAVLPIFVNFQIHYGGLEQISNIVFELISTATGDVLLSQPVNLNQAYHLPVALSGLVYAVAHGNVTSNPNQLVWGTLGSMEFPEAQSLDVNVSLNLGVIELTNNQPKEYMRIGTSYWEQGNEIFPVYHGLFVYKFKSIDWVYRNADYLYLVKHSRWLHSGLITWTLPTNSIWLKINNLGSGDDYFRTQVVDTLGTVIVTRLNTIGNVGYLGKFLCLEYDNSTNILRQYLMPNYCATDTLITFHYNDNSISEASVCYPISVINDFTLLPLSAGNLWHISKLEMPDAPSYLCYGMLYNQPYPMFLFWQAPQNSPHQWTSYRIYRDNLLYGEVPYNQTRFNETEFVVDGYNHCFYVVAYDGVIESEPTYEVWITSLHNNESVIPPATVSIYPNPFICNGNQRLTINVSTKQPSTHQLTIYNLKGQRVMSVSTPQTKDFQYQWNGSDYQNRSCASGIYFIRMMSDNRLEISRKILLLK